MIESNKDKKTINIAPFILFILFPISCIYFFSTLEETTNEMKGMLADNLIKYSQQDESKYKYIGSFKEFFTYNKDRDYIRFDLDNSTVLINSLYEKLPKSGEMYSVIDNDNVFCIQTNEKVCYLGKINLR
jgi:hypothetical protein